MAFFEQYNDETLLALNQILETLMYELFDVIIRVLDGNHVSYHPDLTEQICLHLQMKLKCCQFGVNTIIITMGAVKK